jgi:prepilin-type N-terminal cleavage/methylation domain-containing protein
MRSWKIKDFSKRNKAIRKLRTQRGMTLLEVAIALFVLAIGLLGLAGLQLVVLQHDSQGHEATLATTLAKEKLSQLQNATTPITNGSDQYHDKANGVTYTREWSVHNDIDIPQTNNIVIVRVIWKDTWADRCVTVSSGNQFAEGKEGEGV